ncbi:class I SAM-dependent methyltransferase [Halobaculum limi]|uniref:class I SAM-dependent methyltransferase n=1 Tax=Halobaculum limi TaxID=3031916 RepID=UPI0024076418|nr:class I SAM-dependent methyltransferase [Halobaculum sp. YSMS11]
MTDTDAPHPSPAELYDLQYSDVDRGDVPFYVDCARAADGPVLELACGTGRIHLPLLRAGVDADGIDVDPASLDRLREKAAAEGLDPSVRVGDMTVLDTDREYDLVICPFNALHHATTLAGLQATLAGVHDALAPGGQFVFDVFVPRFDVICETYDEWQERSVEYEGSEYTVRIRSTVADHVEQLYTVETELLAPDGETLIGDRMQLAMFPKRLLEVVVAESPFASASLAGGFDGEDLAETQDVQLWTLEAAE